VLYDSNHEGRRPWCAGKASKAAARAQGAWARAVWLWDRPKLKRLRLTISMAQWTVRLPALLALVASQARGGRAIPYTLYRYTYSAPPPCFTPLL
jgi:hypothetical protein